MRNHVRLGLVGFCREKSAVLGKDDVIQVKEAFKWIMQGLVAKELGGVAVVTKVSDPEEEQKNHLKSTEGTRSM